MFFGYFSDEGKRVILYSQKLALNKKHAQVMPIHIFFAVTKYKDYFLLIEKTELKTVAKEELQKITQADTALPSNLPLSFSAKRTLQNSLITAKTSDEKIAPEHIFINLLDEIWFLKERKEAFLYLLEKKKKEEKEIQTEERLSKLEKKIKEIENED